MPPVRDFTILPEKAFKHDDTDISKSYLARGERVGNGQLTIAQTRSQITEMGEIFVVMALIGLLPTIVVVAFFGALIARTAKRKIGRLQSTLDDLSEISKAVNAMARPQKALVASTLRMILKRPFSGSRLSLNRFL